jgi:hypothetical protein
MRFLLIALLVILALAMLPTWPYSAGWGLSYYPSGLLGLVLLVVVVMALFGAPRSRI